MFTNTELSSSLNQTHPYQYQEHGLYLEGDKKSLVSGKIIRVCLYPGPIPLSPLPCSQFIIPTPVHVHINSLIPFYLDGYDTTLFFGGLRSHFHMSIFAFIIIASWK